MWGRTGKKNKDQETITALRAELDQMEAELESLRNRSEFSASQLEGMQGEVDFFREEATALRNEGREKSSVLQLIAEESKRHATTVDFIVKHHRKPTDMELENAMGPKLFGCVSGVLSDDDLSNMRFNIGW